MTNAIHERTQQIPRKLQVTYSAPRAPIQGPKTPAIRNPRSGRKTISWYMNPVSAFQRIDILNRDRTAIAVISHQNRETDRRFRRGYGEDEEREGLPGQIARKGRTGDEVDVDGQK